MPYAWVASSCARSFRWRDTHRYVVCGTGASISWIRSVRCREIPSSTVVSRAGSTVSITDSASPHTCTPLTRRCSRSSATACTPASSARSSTCVFDTNVESSCEICPGESLPSRTSTYIYGKFNLFFALQYCCTESLQARRPLGHPWFSRGSGSLRHWYACVPDSERRTSTAITLDGLKCGFSSVATQIVGLKRISYLF